MKKSKGKRLASILKRCFKDVNWDRNVFHCGDYQMKSSTGEIQFYETKSIDLAIKKLNRVIRFLDRE